MLKTNFISLKPYIPKNSTPNKFNNKLVFKGNRCIKKPNTIHSLSFKDKVIMICNPNPQLNNKRTLHKEIISCFKISTKTARRMSYPSSCNKAFRCNNLISFEEVKKFFYFKGTFEDQINVNSLFSTPRNVYTVTITKS